MSFLSTGAQGRRCQREEDGGRARREARNLPIVSRGRKTQWPSQTPSPMGSRSLGDRPTQGVPAPARPWPPAACALPGQGVFISRARPGAVSRWGFVEITCSHTLPPRLPWRFRNRAPFSRRGARLRGCRPRIPGRVEKSTQRRRPRRRGRPLSAFATSSHRPPGGQAHLGRGKDQWL